MYGNDDENTFRNQNIVNYEIVEGPWIHSNYI
jgi:hypothetical protein